MAPCQERSHRTEERKGKQKFLRPTIGLPTLRSFRGVQPSYNQESLSQSERGGEKTLQTVSARPLRCCCRDWKESRQNQSFYRRQSSRHLGAICACFPSDWVNASHSTVAHRFQVYVAKVCACQCFPFSMYELCKCSGFVYMFTSDYIFRPNIILHMTPHKLWRGESCLTAKDTREQGNAGENNQLEDWQRDTGENQGTGKMGKQRTGWKPQKTWGEGGDFQNKIRKRSDCRAWHFVQVCVLLDTCTLNVHLNDIMV